MAPTSSSTETPPRRIPVRQVVLRNLANFLPIVGIVLLALGIPSVEWAVRIPMMLLTGYLLFTLTSLFHETAHQTLPALPKWANVLVGRVIGTGLLAPYSVYRQSHIRHHAYLNRPNDWELWPYSDPKTSLWFRRVFVWLDLLFGIVTAPFVYGRIYFHRDSPIKQPEIRWTIFYEYLFMFAFWGSLLTWVTLGGHWPTFLICWGIPHWFAGILQNGRKMTEHLGMSSFDPLQGTRTVVGGNVLARMFSWLNYDIFVHGPHHRFPLLTHDRLENRIREHVEGHPERAYPVYPSYFQAFWAMAPCMVAKPGVGLNAGATTLNNVAASDVTEFLEDEKQIVVGDWDKADSGTA
ncbi:MAG: fatty acid desaturase [Planctomycetaceae bacterium]|nr:fatty acid desaturase [Planctomycetaceae bacterium]